MFAVDSFVPFARAIHGRADFRIPNRLTLDPLLRIVLLKHDLPWRRL